jgi:hypothetical protein
MSGPKDRTPVTIGPTPGATGWLALDDDELLFRVESLPPGHARDDELVEVVRSDRHFFVRQEAAKRIRDGQRLKAFASDRHIGQILVRQMQREEDIGYLEGLLHDSRHLEVRNAARAQLARIRAQLELAGPGVTGPDAKGPRAGPTGSAAPGAEGRSAGRRRRQDD